jgi:hypothetical protein
MPLSPVMNFLVNIIVMIHFSEKIKDVHFKFEVLVRENPEKPF